MKTTVARGRVWHYSHAMGRPSNEDNIATGGFVFPVSIAVASDGLVFVLSRGNGASLSADGSPGISRRIGRTTIDEQHRGDFARNEFTWPTGIAIASDGKVYVSDEAENLIKVFRSDAKYPFPEYGPDGEAIDRWGETGVAEGQLDGPSGLAFDTDDNLYLVDSRNDRVQKFTKEGRHLLSWGGTGAAEGQFRAPWGITIDPAGDIYVADWGNDRVQKFSPGGTYLLSFEGTPEDGGDLWHPADVAVDSDGDVYVTDWGNRRVRIYDPDGGPIAALYGDVDAYSRAVNYARERGDGLVRKMMDLTEDSVDKVRNFLRPTAIEVYPGDRIIVGDARGRLLVYDKDKDYTLPE